METSHCDCKNNIVRIYPITHTAKGDGVAPLRKGGGAVGIPNGMVPTKVGNVKIAQEGPIQIRFKAIVQNRAGRDVGACLSRVKVLVEDKRGNCITQNVDQGLLERGLFITGVAANSTVSISFIYPNTTGKSRTLNYELEMWRPKANGTN